MHVLDGMQLTLQRRGRGKGWRAKRKQCRATLCLGLAGRIMVYSYGSFYMKVLEGSLVLPGMHCQCAGVRVWPKLVYVICRSGLVALDLCYICVASCRLFTFVYSLSCYTTGCDSLNHLIFYSKLVFRGYIINIITRWLGLLWSVNLLQAKYPVYWLGCQFDIWIMGCLMDLFGLACCVVY